MTTFYSGLVLLDRVGRVCLPVNKTWESAILAPLSSGFEADVLFLAFPHLDSCGLNWPCLSPLGNLSLWGSQVWNKSLQSLG